MNFLYISKNEFQDAPQIQRTIKQLIKMLDDLKNTREIEWTGFKCINNCFPLRVLCVNKGWFVDQWKGVSSIPLFAVSWIECRSLIPAICRNYNKIIRERDSTLGRIRAGKLNTRNYTLPRPVDYSVYRPINFCKRLRLPGLVIRYACVAIVPVIRFRRRGACIAVKLNDC